MLEGLPPNGAAHVMRLRCDEVTARRVADVIVETFDPAETAAAAFEAEPSALVSPEWIVEVFFGSPPDEANVRELIAGAAGRAVGEAVSFDLVGARDWVQSSLDGLPAVRAGRFVVHGSHHRGSVRPHEIALEIEAALAFGTGHHGTTRGCLLHFHALLARRRPVRVLDVGTGTGVLAMAAARVLHRRVVAGDIDPVAVAAATRNARSNGTVPWLRPVTARGVRHPAIVAGGRYDLVFANILAKPLRLMAPAIASVADTRAELIVSGLLEADVPGILTAYRAQGFRLRRRLVIEGWASLLMQRGA